jgi:drug/metabolite transporter (DMT)-like permease
VDWTEDPIGRVLPAYLVTFLWSSSWVLIKVGLADIPALPFAGLRYALATLVLLPFVLRPAPLAALRALPTRAWRDLARLGVVLYALTQGAQFLALSLLPAATVALVLSCTPVLVALVAAASLGERLGARQWVGIGVFLAGAALYLAPAGLAGAGVAGLLVAGVGLAANAAASVLGRAVNRSAAVPPLVVTVVSMAIGSAVLLAGGVAVQGAPTLSASGWAIVGWLAVVNTAFAFTLWNRSLQHLTAVESSVINNTMMVQIAVLAWVFLGEALTPLSIAGLALATLGALAVQMRFAAPAPANAR